MGNSFYFIFEPEVIIFLQRILGEAGKYIATFLTYLGEDFLLVGILIFMYWCIDKRYARNIALLVIAGTAAGPMIKNIAKRRRPYMVHDEISCLRPPSSGDINDISIQGFSFPSGHSTNSTLLYGSLALRKGMKRILRVILIIIITAQNALKDFPFAVLHGLKDLLERRVSGDIGILGCICIR